MEHFFLESGLQNFNACPDTLLRGGLTVLFIVACLLLL